MIGDGMGFYYGLVFDMVRLGVCFVGVLFLVKCKVYVGVRLVFCIFYYLDSVC